MHDTGVKSMKRFWFMLDSGSKLVFPAPLSSTGVRLLLSPLAVHILYLFSLDGSASSIAQSLTSTSAAGFIQKQRLNTCECECGHAGVALLSQKHFKCRFCPHVSCRQSESWPLAPPPLLWLPPDSLITPTLRKHLSFPIVFSAGVVCILNR